jgi:hypothetical protein
MKTIFITLAVIVGSLGFASSSQAYSAPHNYTGQPIMLTQTFIQRVQAVAVKEFPTSPCAGQVKAQYDADLTPWLQPGEGALGMAWQDGSCTMKIAPINDAMQWCIVYVHEYGHLAGYQHSDRFVGDDVMRVDHTKPVKYAPCLDAIGARLSSPAARSAIRRQIEKSRPEITGEKITCRRAVTIDLQKCKVTWSGKKQIWHVSRNQYGVEAAS